MRIEKINLVSSLSKAEQANLDKKIIWHAIPKAVQIIGHNEMTSDVYFLSEGCVRSTNFSASGREIAFQDIAAGEIFGELAAIDNGPRTTSIYTLEKCVVGSIRGPDFLAFLAEYPDISVLTLKRLARLVRCLSERIYEFGAFSVKDRVRSEIVRIAREKAKGDNGVVIARMPTRSEISNRISCHREAISREFSYLSQKGLIELNGRSVHVPDIHRLSQLIVENTC